MTGISKNYRKHELFPCILPYKLINQLFLSAFFLFGLTLVACDEENICVAGETQECVCSGGLPGAQVCESSGMRWSSCDCGTMENDGDINETLDGSIDSDDLDGEIDTNELDGCVPFEELCNGLDDDCDGVADNGFDCVAGELVECETACGSTSEGTCTDTCEIPDPDSCIPGPEICGNGIDDDCDDWADPPPTLGEELEIGYEGTQAQEPSIVWNGTRFGLVYVQYGDVYFDLISEDGELIGTSLRLSSTPDTGERASRPKITWSGSEFAAVWEDGAGGPVAGSYFTRLNAGGRVIGTPSRILPDSYRPSIVWNGSGYAVTSVQMNVLSIGLFDPTGTADGKPITITEEMNSQERGHDLAWSGTEYGITYSGVEIGEHNIYFIRLSSSLERIGGFVALGDGSDRSTTPKILWNGTNYGVFWRYEYDVHYASLTETGTISVPDRIVAFHPESGEPTSAWDGEAFVVAWSRFDDSPKLIRVLPSGGVATDIFEFTTRVGRMYYSTSNEIIAVAAGNTTYGIGFEYQKTSTERDLAFLRIDGCW